MILGKATAKVESASNSFSHTCDEREEKEASLLSERRRPRRKAHQARFPTHVILLHMWRRKHLSSAKAESASRSFSHTCDERCFLLRRLLLVHAGGSTQVPSETHHLTKLNY